MGRQEERTATTPYFPLELWDLWIAFFFCLLMLPRTTKLDFVCALAVLEDSRALNPVLLRRFHCRKGMGEACYKRGRRLLPEYYFTEHFARGRILALKSQPKASNLETINKHVNMP